MYNISSNCPYQSLLIICMTRTYILQARRGVVKCRLAEVMTWEAESEALCGTEGQRESIETAT